MNYDNFLQDVQMQLIWVCICQNKCTSIKFFDLIGDTICISIEIMCLWLFEFVTAPYFIFVCFVCKDYEPMYKTAFLQPLTLRLFRHV